MAWLNVSVRAFQQSDLKVSFLLNHLWDSRVIPMPAIHTWVTLSNDYETKKQWSGRKRVRLESVSCLEAAQWYYSRIYSCGWPFSDDDWLERSQAFSLSIAQTVKMTLITAELSFCLWVLMRRCFISLHHAILHVSISSPTFGLLHSSMGLYPLIDFPIESDAGEQPGTDSIHCFHLYDTMMISPAATCQPPLLRSR